MKSPKGGQRDPKRDEAFEIYKASEGKISLVDLAVQLGVGDGTVRGWKAKDGWDKSKWEELNTGEVQFVEPKAGKLIGKERMERNGAFQTNQKNGTILRNVPIK